MLKPLVFAVLYYINFQLFLLKRDFFVWFILAFIIISIIGVYQISERRGFLMILPLAFAFGSLILLLLVTGNLSEQLYIALSAIGFFMTLVQTSKKTRKIDNELWYKINTSIVFVTFFIWFAGLYGMYLSLSRLPFWSFMLLALLVVTVLYYYSIKINEVKVPVSLYLILFAIINLEIIWALGFTHFGHLTIGAILLLVNYTLWDLLENYSKKTLTGKLVFVDIVFFVIIITGLLGTTRWLPI